MEVLQYLLSIKANIMCRDRFNGTPLEDAVRHNFEMRNAVQVQKLLRDNGATLAGEGLDYVSQLRAYFCLLVLSYRNGPADLTNKTAWWTCSGTQVVKMCSYAAEGQVEHIRLLATNGVDVSLGDYDDRTPLVSLTTALRSSTICLRMLIDMCAVSV